MQNQLPGRHAGRINMKYYFKRRNIQILALWAVICLVALCTLGGIFIAVWVLIDQPVPDSSAMVRTPTVISTPTPIIIVVSSTSASPETVTATPIPDHSPEASNTLDIPTDVVATVPVFDSSPSSRLTSTNANPDLTLVPTLDENDAYLVQASDTLDSVAQHFAVSAEDIRSANGMVGDTILTGQKLLIPQNGAFTPSPWRFSTLNTSDYSAALKMDRFTMHYVPGSYPANAIDALAELEQIALDHLELMYGTALQKSFGIYVAGSLFQSPDQGLRGRSFSSGWVNFYLFDGSGNFFDQQYMAVHELTHLYTWNTFGPPVSTMLSEGAAVYSGLKLIDKSDASNRIPLNQFCAAHLEQNALPSLTSPLTFLGHNYDLVNYYSAGCFYGYLLETYGVEKAGKIYSQGNYSQVYGQTLEALEREWHASLVQESLEGIDTAELVSLTRDLSMKYKSFFPKFTGTQNQVKAYRLLDQARIALLENRFSEARQRLQDMQVVLDSN